MAWSAAFRERLMLGGEPMYAVDFKSGDLFRGAGPTAVDRYVLHSHGPPGSMDSKHMPHAIERVTGSGQSVSLRSWRSSTGGLRVQLSGADMAQFISRNIPRGREAQLRIGFAGMSYEEFEPVGLYQYRGLSGSRNSWVMDFDGIQSALQAPGSVSLSAQFMKQASETTTLRTSWGVTESSMDVFNSAEFVKDAAGSGLMYCQPTTGDPFYLKYTDVPDSNTITVVNINVIDTTRAAMAAGDTITALGYVSNDVPAVMQKLLFGYLAGIPMPEEWSMGVDSGSDAVHNSDIANWRNLWLTEYGDFDADFITHEPLGNPYRALEEFMASFGAWLVVKEGRLSWRFVQALVPFGSTGRKAIVTHEITDQDIAGEEGYTLFNPDCPTEFFQCKFGNSRINYIDGGSVGTAPGLFRLDHESKDRVYDEGGAETNRDAASANISQRLGPWYTRIPDSMRLTLASWKFADLVPGDVVSVQSDYLLNMLNSVETMFGSVKIKRHTGTPYMVTAVDVDWDGFTVNVELSSPPYSNSRYS